MTFAIALKNSACNLLPDSCSIEAFVICALTQSLLSDRHFLIATFAFQRSFDAARASALKVIFKLSHIIEKQLVQF